MLPIYRNRWLLERGEKEWLACERGAWIATSDRSKAERFNHHNDTEIPVEVATSTIGGDWYLVLDFPVPPKATVPVPPASPVPGPLVSRSRWSAAGEDAYNRAGVFCETCQAFVEQDHETYVYRCHGCGAEAASCCGFLDQRQCSLIKDHGPVMPHESSRGLQWPAPRPTIAESLPDPSPQPEIAMTTTPADHPEITKVSYYNNHPSGIECRAFAKHFSWNLGSVVVYLWRAGKKPGVPASWDMRKAAQHLEYMAEEKTHFSEWAVSREAIHDVHLIRDKTTTDDLFLRKLLYLLGDLYGEAVDGNARRQMVSFAQHLRAHADRLDAAAKEQDGAPPPAIDSDSGDES